MQTDDCVDLFGFDLDGMEDIERELEDAAARARAVKTRAIIQARRASSEAVLARILPEEIAEGDAWHVLSSGDVDSLSFLAHVLSFTALDYVAFSTWCMAVDDVEKLGLWLRNGRIGRLDAYVGEIFPGTYIKEHALLRETVRPGGGRVAIFRNHSKVFLCRAGARAWVIESSANINTNPRTENTVITSDLGLFEHHKAYFDSIKSFARDFDEWAPTT